MSGNAIPPVQPLLPFKVVTPGADTSADVARSTSRPQEDVMIRRALFSFAFGCLLLSGAAALASAAVPSDPPDPGTNPSTGTSEPPAAPLSVSGSLSFASRYLFQGLDYSAGKPVLNPEVDLSAGPLGAKLWVNHDLDLRVSNEFDFSLLHEWKAKKFSFATGYTY